MYDAGSTASGYVRTKPSATYLMATFSRRKSPYFPISYSAKPFTSDSDKKPFVSETDVNVPGTQLLRTLYPNTVKSAVSGTTSTTSFISSFTDSSTSSTGAKSVDTYSSISLLNTERYWEGSMSFGKD